MTKGQVSLEYLMTYGIAIAIVVIAVAALYSMGVFSPKGSTVACSPCFANFAFVDYADGSLVIKNGARELSGVNVTCTPDPNNCSTKGALDASEQFTVKDIDTSGDIEVELSYTDVLSELNHTDTATIHN